MHFTLRPISDRTMLGQKVEDSRFTVGYSHALELLDRELTMLKATDIVLELDVREDQIRLDGQLRANTKAGRAVRLAFDSKHGPLTYATDQFVRSDYGRSRYKMREDWQHNLYAIALGLEALRLVARYGIASRDEQYRGYKAIGGGTALPAAPTMTAGDAVRAVYDVTGLWLDGDPTSEATRASYRRARGLAHPDRNGGDRERWDVVEEAARVLGIQA